MMSWIAPLAILLAGAAGGAVNVLMNGGGGIDMGGFKGDEDGHLVWKPGPLATPCVGAVAALVSWALYGAAAGASIFQSPPNAVTWSSIGAAIFVGIGGSAWLSAEVDKSILRKTAATAAQSNADPGLAAAINAGTPIQALSAAVAARNISVARAAERETLVGPAEAQPPASPPKAPI